jgi:hypothetical protein
MGSPQWRYLRGAERSRRRRDLHARGRGLLTNLAAAAARRKGPSDLEGYDLFALGMADFNKGGEDGFTKSIKLFDAATAKDPQFAFAYVKKGWAIFNYALPR